jgi:hypothetical protein
VVRSSATKAEEALAALDAVEDSDSPVPIIISVSDAA